MRTAIGVATKASTNSAVVTKRSRSTRRGARGTTGPDGGGEGRNRAEELGRRYEERAVGVRAMRRGGGRDERTPGFRLPRFPRVARLDAERMRKGDATTKPAPPSAGSRSGNVLPKQEGKGGSVSSSAFWGCRLVASVKSAAEQQKRRGVVAYVAPTTAESSARTVNGVAESQKGGECFGVFCVTYDLKEGERPETWKKTVRVAVSGAAGMIANHLLFKLASGEVFGQDQPIALNLLGSERSREALEGVAMELEDSLFPLLREVNIGISAEEVFADADWALLIGAKPRGPGMERADLLEINGKIFAEQGKALNKVASPDVKVLVVGNPCNTNALIALKNAPRLNPRNFHALTRLDENRAKCQLALKAGVFYDNVSNVTIWGNHSTTQVPDFLNAKIHRARAVDVIQDEMWLKEEFTPRVQKRGGALIQKWGRSSAASTAVSIADAIKSLINPTPEGDWFSSGVYSNGNPYGIAEDLIFSMPCRSTGDGNWELVTDCEIDDYLYERIKKSEDELIAEKKCVAHLTGEQNGYCDLPDGDTMLPGEQ